MNLGNSESEASVSRRTIVELLAGCSCYALTAGHVAAAEAIVADTSPAAGPSIGLIKDLLGRLDDKLLQGIAVTQLSMIESDYFGHPSGDRPPDLWECMETWPTEARQEAVATLSSMGSTPSR